MTDPAPGPTNRHSGRIFGSDDSDGSDHGGFGDRHGPGCIQCPARCDADYLGAQNQYVSASGGRSSRSAGSEMTVFSNEEIRRSSRPLTGQTVVVIGGSRGIGRATALEARAEGADVILTGRDPNHLRLAAQEVGALSTAAFDATEHERLERFFAELPQPIDHVLVTAGGSYYALLPDMDLARVRGALEEHLLLTLNVARSAIGTVRPGGTLIFITGTDARHPGPVLAVAGVFAAALPALIANLAFELAPIRVNLLAAGFVDTRCRRHCSATISPPVAQSLAEPCPSGGLWNQRMWPHSLFTS
jgi:NAD(P)-dependent dehydrogenase (short-subunit alcohol dehydrogenase family)